MRADEDTLSQIYYGQDVMNYPVLSKEEQHRLLLLNALGNSSARNRLVEHNQRFVKKVAIDVISRFSMMSNHIMDLIQEGNIGLWIALGGFDVTRGYSLTTYAYWRVFSEMNRYRWFAGYAVPIPTTIESADGLSAREMWMHTMPIPLETTIKDTELTISDVLDAGDTEYTDFELTYFIDQLLSGLSPERRHLLRLRFGLETGHPLSLEKIGLYIGRKTVHADSKGSPRAKPWSPRPIYITPVGRGVSKEIARTELNTILEEVRSAAFLEEILDVDLVA